MIRINRNSVRKGMWIQYEQRFDGTGLKHVMKCSVCGFAIAGLVVPIEDMMFCPHCGVKMEE